MEWNKISFFLSKDRIEMVKNRINQRSDDAGEIQKGITGTYVRFWIRKTGRDG
jgi:hypothetical protein